MKISKVTSGGRVTIPVELRKKYKLKPGTRVNFVARLGSALLEIFYI